MKSFFEISSGIDIKYLSNVAAESAEIDDIARKALHVRSMIQRTQESIRAVDKCEKPVIAAIHGYCIGLVLNNEYICLHLEEVDIGLAADVGTLQILPKLINDHSLFRELVLTSRTYDTNEEQQIGLIR
ncbi:unnamed protein product [Rotaria sp. Silwood2]|nr:unnamed protein product [Rotaria sp. Silwood2]